jgi:hypothetical protein
MVVPPYGDGDDPPGWRFFCLQPYSFRYFKSHHSLGDMVMKGLKDALNGAGSSTPLIQKIGITHNS